MTRWALLAFALAAGCGNDDGRPPARDLGVVVCTPARASEPIPFRRAVVSATLSLDFTELTRRVDDACGRCHLETITGGFRYSDVYASGNPDRPGLSEAADRMVKRLLAGEMPPPASDPTPEKSHLLALAMKAWIDAGKPQQDRFTVPTGGGASDDPAGAFPRLGPDQAEAMSNLGSCVPEPSTTRAAMQDGTDKDDFFAAATALPSDLRDTDLTTFDAATLAQDGVFAYVPTYQLWSDDAHKLRMVRVPRGQKIAWDPTTRTMRIPPNTRFYKTFFKRTVEPDGHVGYRAMETRLIVSRPPKDGVEQALFGTYLWDETQTHATLWDGPYRDGTPFRDLLFSYIDQLGPDGQPHQHTYAIPARHRCVQCHEGSETQSFVLGVTPLQVNRRRQGQGGVTSPVGDDELSQVERLIAYGVLDAPGGAAGLPLLEASGGDRLPRNDYELRAQAYMAGNCAHCHNPRGFPVRDEPRLRDFDLSPGGIVFQFPLKKSAVSTALAYYVDPLALDLDRADASLILRRVATDKTTVWRDTNDQTHLVVAHMPANTPGMDCRAGDILGRWIASVPVDNKGDALADDTPPDVAKLAQAQAAFSAMQFHVDCVPPDDVDNWVPEDLTEPKVYTPRRSDFAAWSTSEDGIDPFIHPDLIHGMPKVFRDLAVDESMAQVSSAKQPYGFWRWKPECRFPDGLASPADRRAWMLTPDGEPRRPLGEVFYETPGAGIFRAVCANCHGARANGLSGNAKALLQLSNGTIRVANLMQGLFGPMEAPGTNLALFDQPGPNGLTIAPFGAAKYLVWMTSGGTSVKFPDGFESLLGAGDKKFGGNMLTKVSYYCSRLLPSQFWIGELRGDAFQSGIPDEKRELWTAFCGFRNQPIPPADAVPPSFDAESWLRTAQLNGGLMMFFFFRDYASRGVFAPGPDECERVYGASP